MSTQDAAHPVLLLPAALALEAPVRRALLANPTDDRIGSACVRWLAEATITPLPGLTWSDAERAVLGLGTTDGRTGLATPMHFVLALTDLTGTDPETIALDEAESSALCAACDAHLAPEGVRFGHLSPSQWRVSLSEPIEVQCERPLWLAGEPIRALLPRGRDARRVERWMNELQMLLHGHPVNRARVARGALPVNGVWLWGFDGLPPAPEAVVTEFTRALAVGDVAAWQQAWGLIAERLVAAEEVILGDNRPRVRLTRGEPGWFARLRARWRPADLAAVLERIAAVAQSSPT
ncbi:MAG: hypothetical protein ACK4XK_05860 [Casimicrobiaceae bacterium]